MFLLHLSKVTVPLNNTLTLDLYLLMCFVEFYSICTALGSQLRHLKINRRPYDVLRMLEMRLPIKIFLFERLHRTNRSLNEHIVVTINADRLLITILAIMRYSFPAN